MKGTSSKKVLANSIIYTLSGLLLKCFSFFLLPLYTQYLTTEDYGLTSLSSSFITSMSYVVALSLFSAIMRFYVDLKDDSHKLKRFYGTITNFILISGSVWVVLLVLFREPLGKYVFSGAEFYPAILVTVLSLIFNCLHTLYATILRSQQKSLKVSLLSIAYFFVTLAFNVLFVVLYDMGAVGVILATFIANVLYTIYFLCDMYIGKRMTFCMDMPLLKSSIKYSLPILPHNLSTQIALLISKALIGNADSMASLGVYSVAAQFGNIAETIQVYVDQAYSPWLYGRLNAREPGYKNNIRKIANLLCSFIGLFFIGVSLFAHDYIVVFTNESYVDAWKMVPLIISVYALKTAYYFYVAILFYNKQASRYLFIATVSSSLLNVFLSVVIVPIYGAYGSIVCDLVAMLLRVAIIYGISRKYEDIGLKLYDFIFNYLFIMITIGIGLIPSFLHFENRFSLTNFLYKVGIVFVYIAVIVYKNRSYIPTILSMVRNKKSR